MKKCVAVLIVVIIIVGVPFVPGYVFAQQPTPLKQIETSEELIEVLWNPSNDMLAVATKTGAKIYNDSLQELTTLPDYTERVVSLAWNPTGEYIAGVGLPDESFHLGTVYDFSVLIWKHDVNNGSFSLETTLKINPEPDFLITTVSWSPDGTKLATIGLQVTGELTFGRLQIWNTNDWTLESTVEDEYEYMKSIAWSPDSSKIASGGILFQDPVFFIADVTTGDRIAVDYLTIEPNSIAWSQNDQLVIAYFDLNFYDPISYQHTSTIDVSAPAKVVWHPDNQKIVIGSWSGLVEIRDVATTASLWNIQVNGFRDLDIHPDGSKLAVISDDNILGIWDVSNLPDPSGTPTITPLPSATPSSQSSPGAR